MNKDIKTVTYHVDFNIRGNRKEVMELNEFMRLTLEDTVARIKNVHPDMDIKFSLVPLRTWEEIKSHVDLWTTISDCIREHFHEVK